MVTNMTRRRTFLRQLGLVGAGLLLVPGCGLYEAETGVAYAPWRFPGGETLPERLAARAALLAASPHNTQPWAIGVDPARLDLRARLDRNLGTMDSLGRELHIGLGCALENLVLAARAGGRVPDVSLLPEPADPALVARVGLTVGPADKTPLFDAIARRHTNRGAYADVVAPGLEAALRSLFDEPTLSLHYLATESERARVRAETIAATEAIIADREMSADSARWYRHSAEEIERHRDGPTLDATGNAAVTRTFGKILSRPSDSAADEYWLDGTRKRQTTGSAFVVLASSAANERVDQLRVGRVYQRMHLWATSQGLGMQPLNQLAERQDREQTQGLEPRFGRVLEDLIGRERRAQMLFRIGYPWDEAFASPRRPLEWVMA